MPDQQALYASEFDQIFARLDRKHSRGIFGPDLTAEPDMADLALVIERRLARRLRTAPVDQQEELLDTWYAALELLKRLGVPDEPPSERAGHVHSLACGQQGRPACGCVAGESEGYLLPGPVVPHPSGGFASPRAVVVEECAGEPFSDQYPVWEC
jgi:hypothetical protein